MALLFFIGTFILQIKGTPKAAEILAQSGDLSFYIYALKQSLMFTGGIAVVLLGVRMFIGEMVPAFNGIGSRLVPGAKPALDCPILFNFAPNAVVLGFVGAFVGSLLWLTLIGRYTGYVFIPSMIVIFFHAGTAGSSAILPEAIKARCWRGLSPPPWSPGGSISASPALSTIRSRIPRYGQATAICLSSRRSFIF